MNPRIDIHTLARDLVTQLVSTSDGRGTRLEIKRKTDPNDPSSPEVSLGGWGWGPAVDQMEAGLKAAGIVPWNPSEPMFTFVWRSHDRWDVIDGAGHRIFTILGEFPCFYVLDAEATVRDRPQTLAEAMAHVCGILGKNPEPVKIRPRPPEPATGGAGPQKKWTPCGGCGAADPKERCINCFHDFGPGGQIRKY